MPIIISSNETIGKEHTPHETLQQFKGTNTIIQHIINSQITKEAYEG